MTEHFHFQNLLKKIKKHNIKVGIVGIGYVGIQLLIQFCSKKIFTIGFDKDKKKNQ